MPNERSLSVGTLFLTSFGNRFKIWFFLAVDVPRKQSELRRFVNIFCSNFQKNRLTDFQKCRIALIWGALEISDPGASNGGSNVEIGPNAVDLEVDQKLSLKSAKKLAKNISFCQLGFFKRDEISSKTSNADVWPAVRCVRIRALQRRSNHCCTTNLWGCSASFVETRRNVRISSKISPQSLKKLPEYGLYGGPLFYEPLENAVQSYTQKKLLPKLKTLKELSLSCFTVESCRQRLGSKIGSL